MLRRSLGIVAVVCLTVGSSGGKTARRSNRNHWIGQSHVVAFRNCCTTPRGTTVAKWSPGYPRLAEIDRLSRWRDYTKTLKRRLGVESCQHRDSRPRRVRL